jgi:hypothetical protein
MWKPRLVLAALTVAAAFAAAPSALAGTATYNSTGPLFVPEGLVRTSTISVPSGRTPVQSVEVTTFRAQWPASGQDLSTQLIGPGGAFLNLFEVGCFSFQSTDVWAFSDSASQAAFNDKNDPKCDLPGGTFRPVDLPENRKLSIFSGEGSGTWTLRATDKGLIANQGSIQSWAVRIVHAPPTLTATAPPSLNLTGPLTVTAQSNANGTVATSGDIAPGTAALAANVPTPVPFTVSAPVRDLINQQGTARVNINLAFTDETGGTAASAVSVEVKGTATGTATGNATGTAKAKKCKKKRRAASSAKKKKCKKRKR